MASDSHERIIKIIKGVFDEYFTCKEEFLPIERVHNLKINDPDSKAVIDYTPDFVIKRNTSKHTHYFIVFEVIEGQTDDKTMADIARLLALGSAVKKVFFVCNNINKFNETGRIADTLIGAYKLRFRKKNRKDIIDISVKAVPNSISDGEIKKNILKEIKQFLPAGK